MRQAVCIAIIFEFLGAFLAGSRVADTIRAGIADYNCFIGQPELLMYGNLCVMISVGIWLVIATKYEMPVSTTHSCVGGMIGMAIVAKGGDCVVWSADGNEDNLYIPKGVVAIILSWIISPVLCATISGIFYFLIRTFILRAKNSETKVRKMPCRRVPASLSEMAALPAGGLILPHTRFLCSPLGRLLHHLPGHQTQDL